MKFTVQIKILELAEMSNIIAVYVLCSLFDRNNTHITEEASTFCCAAAPLRLSDLLANYAFS